MARVWVPILLNFLIAVSYSQNLNRIDPIIQQRIDNFVKNVYLPFVGVSGCGLGVVQNDEELLYTNGYGYADHQQQNFNGNQTQFLLASVTKSITSLVVAKILHESFPELGETVLDTPIKMLMPNVDFTLNDRVRSKQTTFRDLLSHKMCLPRDDFPLFMEPYQNTTELLYRQRYVKESCGFRTKLVYNNQMVLMASDLIGQLVGQNFIDYTEKFLKQVGMHHSAFIRTEDNFSILNNRAKPYYIKDGRSHPINPDLIKRLVPTQAFGGLYTTPNDMIRFIRLNLNAGKLDGQQIVPANVISWLSKPSNGIQQMKFKKSDDDSVVESYLAYGLGLVIGAYNGWEKISHNGVFPPYSTEMSWYPALNIGIFSSTHESPNLSMQAGLHMFIFEVVRGNNRAEELVLEHLKQKSMEFEDEKLERTRAVSKFLGQFKRKTASDIVTFNEINLIGKYGNVVSGEVEVSLKFNEKTKKHELYIGHGKWAKGWIESFGTKNIDGDGGVQVFIVDWVTDIVQDNYAMGETDFFRYVTISSDGLFTFVITLEKYGMVPMATFKKGLDISVENLDPVPWRSDLCE